jgi:hypothetical protein
MIDVSCQINNDIVVYAHEFHRQLHSVVYWWLVVTASKGRLFVAVFSFCHFGFHFLSPALSLSPSHSLSVLNICLSNRIRAVRFDCPNDL